MDYPPQAAPLLVPLLLAPRTASEFLCERGFKSTPTPWAALL